MRPEGVHPYFTSLVATQSPSRPTNGHSAHLCELGREAKRRGGGGDGSTTPAKHSQHDAAAFLQTPSLPFFFVPTHPPFRSPGDEADALSSLSLSLSPAPT